MSVNGESVNETYVAALRDRFIATVNRVDAAARAAYRRDEIQGLRISNIGGASNRTYTDAEVAFVRRTGRLPDGYVVHHTEWVSQAPLLAGTRSNLIIRTTPEHYSDHYGK